MDFPPPPHFSLFFRWVRYKYEEFFLNITRPQEWPTKKFQAFFIANKIFSSWKFEEQNVLSPSWPTYHERFSHIIHSHSKFWGLRTEGLKIFWISPNVNGYNFFPKSKHFCELFFWTFSFVFLPFVNLE